MSAPLPDNETSQWLRQLARQNSELCYITPAQLHEAADEIERLQALADQLADALGNEWPGISNKPYSDVSTAHAATTAALAAWAALRCTETPT